MDHSTTTHGSGSLLGQLRSHKLALFCGAGISILPPSSLPNWRALADGVIRAIGQAAGETPRLADLAQGSGRPYLGQLLQAELRPDVVMEIIYDIMQERALGALEVLDIITPNANHFLIAHLAGAGFLNCVLTTNFDRLIEIACQQQGVPVRTVVTPEEYATDPGPDQGLTLYKLHGSIERPETMVASIDNITRGLDQQKEAVLQRLLSSQYFLFLGYSGNDFAINADYLLLERTRPLVLGITWNLRPGEESAIVSGLLDHYGEKGEVVHAELPSLLRELCVGLGIEPPPLPETEPVERPPLEESLAAWGENLSEIDVCFGLGRLYLYSGNWDGALESMKIFYRKVRDLKQGTYRDLGLASYYLAHAYERFKAFNKFDTDTVFDIFLLLNQARITFTTLGDEFMLARAYHTEARYVGEQDLQRAWSLYQQALDTYEAAGATAELGEALVDMGDLLSTSDARNANVAWDCLQKGYRVASSVGDLRQMVRAVSAMGYVLFWEHRSEESRQALAQALRWARILGDPAILQAVLFRLGAVLTMNHELEDARTVLAESVGIAETMGAAAPLFSALNSLAVVQEQLDDLEEAGKNYGLVSIMAPMLKRSIAGNNAQLGVARVLFKRGELQAAKREALQALFSVEDRNWPNYQQAFDQLHQVTSAIVQAQEEAGGPRQTGTS